MVDRHAQYLAVPFDHGMQVGRGGWAATIGYSFLNGSGSNGQSFTTLKAKSDQESHPCCPRREGNGDVLSKSEEGS